MTNLVDENVDADVSFEELERKMATEDPYSVVGYKKEQNNKNGEGDLANFFGPLEPQLEVQPVERKWTVNEQNNEWRSSERQYRRYDFCYIKI